jgi:hypothetical protein
MKHYDGLMKSGRIKGRTSMSMAGGTAEYWLRDDLLQNWRRN